MHFTRSPQVAKPGVLRIQNFSSRPSDSGGTV